MRVRGAKSGFRRTITLRRNFRRNLTSAELRFWQRIANRQFFGLKFRRQHGIGPYIVDFYCPARCLIIEIDGDTHAGLEAERADHERTGKLVALGYTVIRYTNREVLQNIDEVLEALAERIRLL